MLYEKIWGKIVPLSKAGRKLDIEFWHAQSASARFRGNKEPDDMKSEQLRKHHVRAFAKLSLFDRLSWAFAQRRFLSRFMNSEARNINKNIRRNDKKYFGS